MISALDGLIELGACGMEICQSNALFDIWAVCRHDEDSDLSSCDAE
jgi:hypothetical protein